MNEGNGSSGGSKRFAVCFLLEALGEGDRDDWAIRRNRTVHRFVSCLRPVTRQVSNARYRSNSKFHQPWNLTITSIQAKRISLPVDSLPSYFSFFFSSMKSRRKLDFTIRARYNGKYLGWRTRGEFKHACLFTTRNVIKKRKTTPSLRVDELFHARPFLEIHESPFHDRSSPPLFPQEPKGQDLSGIVTSLHRKSNNFLGEIAATVYQHVGHLSNRPCVSHLWYSSNDKTRGCINQPPCGWFMPSLWQWDTS